MQLMINGNNPMILKDPKIIEEEKHEEIPKRRPPPRAHSLT